MGYAMCLVLTGWSHWWHSVATPATFSYGVLEVQYVPRQPHTITKLNEAFQREIAAIPVAIFTNVMRKFHDRLQKRINFKACHLAGIIYQT